LAGHPAVAPGLDGQVRVYLGVQGLQFVCVRDRLFAVE
jgi:hypothetical protein